ncbi:MAG: hypothetical protein EG825_06145 [Rhodocyclaceae bacterium]|nr:hypothetical protein [Rhodocyclaceae bacterium]
MRPYLVRLALFVFALLGVIAGFDAFIDPYDVFGTPTVDGINRVKHGIRTHTRTAKAYVVRRVQPKTIILGSSRAESAFRPSHPGFTRLPVYNLAFSGAGIYEVMRYFQHAVSVAPVEEAVIALDFGMFDPRTHPAWDFKEERLAVDSTGRPQPTPWADLASLLLSGDALKESWKSLRQQRAHRTTYGPDGLRDESFDIPEILNEYGGHRKTFLGNEQMFACLYAGYGGHMAFTDTSRHLDTLDLARQIMDLAVEKKVRLTLLIPPLHVRHLETLHQGGVWSSFEEWKRSLTALAAQRDIPLWDFAQANPITTEELPPLGDRSTAMRWFRESSHALSSAGSAALDRIYGVGLPAYGRQLRPDNIDFALAQDREALSAWHVSHSDDVTEIRSLFPRCAPGQTRYNSR